MTDTSKDKKPAEKEALIAEKGAEKRAKAKDGKSESKEDANKAVENKVSYTALFRFASPTDKVLMGLGLFGAIANGVALPLMVNFLVSTSPRSNAVSHRRSSLVWH